MRNRKFWMGLGIGFLLTVFIAWGFPRVWNYLTKDLYVENLESSKPVLSAVDEWEEQFNEWMLARYFLGEVEAEEIEPEILRANTIVCNANIQDSKGHLVAEPIGVLLFGLHNFGAPENVDLAEVNFTDKEKNVKSYKITFVYISPSPGQLSDARMRSVSFSDKGEYWGNGYLLLTDDEDGNSTYLHITDGVGRFSLF